MNVGEPRGRPRLSINWRSANIAAERARLLFHAATFGAADNGAFFALGGLLDRH